jgi:hypothetical protein
VKQGPSPSPELQEGRRDLDSVAGYQLLTDLTWVEDIDLWALKFRITVPVEAGDVRDTMFPESTDWFALVDARYPAGKIVIFPAAELGISGTYPHQKRNLEPIAGLPWRQGEICVTTPFASYGRKALDEEPHGVAERLQWHVARTRTWIEKARRGKLLDSGDPFELPIYPAPRFPIVVFDGQAADLSLWLAQAGRFGYADVGTPGENTNLRTVIRFRNSERKSALVVEAKWGTLVTQSTQRRKLSSGIWVFADRFPVCDPWRAPESWGELQSWGDNAGIDLLSIIRELARPLRDSRRHIMLLGAPVVSRVGGTPSGVHWLALQLPMLSSGRKFASGWRNNQAGYWRRDKQELLNDSSPVEWLPTENWSADELATRGRANVALRNANVVLVGCGAMGSAVADLLVREGVSRLTLMDPELFNAGNLVRHSLGIDSVGFHKARRLSERLNSANPHAKVQSFSAAFPGGISGESASREADILLDCTGSDRLIEEMAEIKSNSQQLFVSAFTGLFAERLYVFSACGTSYPLREFADEVNPWILREREFYAGEELPWEGTGCWHPVFPGRASAFSLFAAALVRRIEGLMISGNCHPQLLVMESSTSPTGVIELREVGLTSSRIAKAVGGAGA